MNKIKVVLSGLIFPFTMMHFFWRAFERRNDVDLFVAGPYTDDWIPWNNGIRLPKKYVKVPNLALPATMSNMHPNSKVVEVHLPWKDVDLWIQCDAGWHFINRPNAKVVAHIQTDPHVLKSTYTMPKAYSDLKFCMQTPYMNEDEIYLSYAYDPDIHFPMPLEKKYDACLIGLQYEHRNLLVNRLRSLGLNVYYSIGEVYDEYRQLYNESKIALSWSSMQDLPARVWEAIGMGLPLVCNRVPDMNLHFEEGKHYLGFDTISEAEKQVMTLITNDELQKHLSKNALLISTGNSWDNRVEYIMNNYYEQLGY